MGFSPVNNFFNSHECLISWSRKIKTNLQGEISLQRPSTGRGEENSNDCVRHFQWYHFTHLYHWRYYPFIRDGEAEAQRCYRAWPVSWVNNRAIPEYRAWFLSIAPCKVKANNKVIGCYIQEWSRWISGEPNHKKNSCVLLGDLPFPPCWPWLLPRSQDRTAMKKAVWTWSLSPLFWFCILSSNAFLFCFLGLDKHQHLLSNSSFMLRWK